MTDRENSKLCEIECMILNETAITITQLIRPEVKKIPTRGTIGIDTNNWLVTLEDVNPDKIVCKTGWRLT